MKKITYKKSRRITFGLMFLACVLLIFGGALLSQVRSTGHWFIGAGFLVLIAAMVFDWTFSVCPVCGEYLDIRTRGDYCPHCGAKLSDAKEPLPGDVTFEEAELYDDVLRELIEMSEDWEKEDSCRGYRKNEVSDIEGNRIFLAKKGEETVGYLFGHTEEAKKSSSVMPDGTPYFEVEELYVRPSCRSRGIGRALFLFAKEAVSSEVSWIMLSTATKNWKAIMHFYIEELGMEFWNARLFCGTGKEDG